MRKLRLLFDKSSFFYNTGILKKMVTVVKYVLLSFFQNSIINNSLFIITVLGLNNDLCNSVSFSIPANRSCRWHWNNYLFKVPLIEKDSMSMSPLYICKILKIICLTRKWYMGESWRINVNFEQIKQKCEWQKQSSG